MILKYEICFDNHRMESGTQEEKWFHYSYLPELIPCDIIASNYKVFVTWIYYDQKTIYDLIRSSFLGNFSQEL